jgi:hypothetical protein
MTAASPDGSPAEFDCLTDVVWDHGLASRAVAWRARTSEMPIAARFLEPASQSLRTGPVVVDLAIRNLASRLRRGYLLLDFELIPRSQRQAVANHYARLARNGRFTEGDAQSSTRLVRYNEPFARSAQSAFCPVVSNLAGQRLMPTFTYTARYQSDGTLPFHLDRPQCEVTLAICIDRHEAAAPGRSMLCIVDGATTACAELRGGWGLIFRGRDYPHGRVTMGSGSDWPTVMLLHYVGEAFAGEIM